MLIINLVTTDSQHHLSLTSLQIGAQRKAPQVCCRRAPDALCYNHGCHSDRTFASPRSNRCCGSTRFCRWVTSNSFGHEVLACARGTYSVPWQNSVEDHSSGLWWMFVRAEPWLRRHQSIRRYHRSCDRCCPRRSWMAATFLSLRGRESR